MPRFASIDIGTNSVLLLVADRGPDGKFTAVLERAEITRLGKGVDQSKTLAPESIAATLDVLEVYVRDARALGAEGIAATATSAARDASNGPEFLATVKAKTGVAVEIIPGDEEARLSFASAWADFGRMGALVVLDIGGGSTEFIYGEATGQVAWRKSFDVGSVRLTERFAGDRARIRAHLTETFAALPQPPAGFLLVGVAGTVTTICAVANKVEPYDAAQVHGAMLPAAQLTRTADLLWATPLEERRALPGLQPKRADVIPAGAEILVAAAAKLGAAAVCVSDRGLRWGLLADRFGGRR